MMAELSQHKFRSLGRAAGFIAASRRMTLEQFVHYDFLVDVAAFDGGIAVWKEKYRHDAVRPFSAIRFLHGERPVTAWGGPGRGTVDGLPGRAWTSYLPTGDHPEYPSGSACFCAAYAQAARRHLGLDRLGWQLPVARGSSDIEPGVTPRSDLTLRFDTWTDFERACGDSRIDGGVHFRAAVDEGARMCRPFGDRAYDLVQAHIQGTAGPAAR